VHGVLLVGPRARGKRGSKRAASRPMSSDNYGEKSEAGAPKLGRGTSGRGDAISACLSSWHKKGEGTERAIRCSKRVKDAEGRKQSLDLKKCIYAEGG